MKTQERMQGFSAGKLSFAHNKQTNKRDLLQQAHCANLINIKKHHCSRSLDFICSSRHYNNKKGIIKKHQAREITST